jgi:PleD family two-component response regulator
VFTETVIQEVPGKDVANSPQQVVAVDESPTQIALYERSVQPLKAELRAFPRAAEALDHLAQNNVDLLFLDLVMTDTEGLTFLRSVRALERHANLNVVVVTSKDYAQDRVLAKELGALDYLVKPLRSQEIREIICKFTDAQAWAADPAEK